MTLQKQFDLILIEITDFDSHSIESLKLVITTDQQKQLFVDEYLSLYPLPTKY